MRLQGLTFGCRIIRKIKERLKKFKRPSKLHVSHTILISKNYTCLDSFLDEKGIFVEKLTRPTISCSRPQYFSIKHIFIALVVLQSIKKSVKKIIPTNYDQRHLSYTTCMISKSPNHLK